MVQMLLFHMEKMEQDYFPWHFCVSLLSHLGDLMLGYVRQRIHHFSSIKLSNMWNTKSCVKTAFLGAQ